MKALLLSTFDIDGGAARAAYRLHEGFQTIGVNSQMLVRNKYSANKAVISGKNGISQLGAKLDRLPLKIYPSYPFFSSQWFPDTILPQLAGISPDIINIHWICGGYLRIETIAKFNKPLVWTLHDMWPFTGGCHYTQECDRYTDSCGACPQIESSKNCDLSNWVWQRKAKAWKGLDLTIVSPSEWLAERANSSSLFKDLRIEVIPHGLDIEKYKPIAPDVARKLLNLPQDKHLVLFGAASSATGDPRKGLHLLHAALQKLSQSGWQDKLELVIFGMSQPEKPIDLGFKTHYLGKFHDDLSLVVVYSAADVMIVPSVQEAFGQTASESLACGIPVVGFNGTGVKDIVTHQQDGYLATPFEIEDLAQGIVWILEDRERHEKLKFHAREKAEQEFTLELQARRYLSLFNELVNQHQQ